MRREGRMIYPEDYINKIICGDCVEVMKEIPDNSVDLVLTDPPWNVKKDYGKYKDNLSKSDYQSLIVKLKDEWLRIAKKHAIVLGSVMLKQWWDVFSGDKLVIIKLGAIVLTRKNNFHLQWKAVLTDCNSNKFMTDLWEDIRWPGEGYYFNEPRYGHPAMTPLKLMKKMIDIFTEENDIVLDPFLGSGTTAVACKQLGRRFIGIEINQGYCKIAEERLKLTRRDNKQLTIR